MAPEGWTSYELRRPPDVLCKFCYGKVDIPIVCKPSELHPQINMSGLLWQLTGIGREYLESLSPEARMQVVAISGWYGPSGFWASMLGDNAGLGASYQGFSGSFLEDL